MSDPAPGTFWIIGDDPAPVKTVYEVEDSSRADVVICKIIAGSRARVGARAFPWRRLWTEGRMEQLERA